MNDGAADTNFVLSGNIADAGARSGATPSAPSFTTGEPDAGQILSNSFTGEKSMLQQYHGTLNRVGSLGGGGMITTNNGVGNVRVAHEISVLEIGDKMLRGVRCTSDLYDLLDPGREGCVFIFRHFFYKPVLIGVRYDDGKKYTLGLGQTIASLLSYILIFPLLAVVFGFMIGLMGGKEGGFMAGLGVTSIVGGVLLSWLQALLLLISYVVMKAK